MYNEFMTTKDNIMDKTMEHYAMEYAASLVVYHQAKATGDAAVERKAFNQVCDLQNILNATAADYAKAIS